MRNIKIVSDSSSDVLGLEGVKFASAALHIVTADREFVDDAYLDVGQMTDYLAGYKGRSHTACPNLRDYLEAFGDAEEIVCVTITGSLSGSYNAACAAKQVYEFEHPDRRVFVIDSLSAGPELRLIVEKLAEYIKAELSYDEICKKIVAYQQDTGLLFMLKSMNNLANNGRVSKIVAKSAGVVGLCLVGKASERGTLEALGKHRGEHQALDAIVAQLRAQGLRSGRVCIAHCSNESAAHELREKIEASFSGVRVDLSTCRGLCSFYAERGGLLVGFEKN